jgi:hypothetical protein
MFQVTESESLTFRCPYYSKFCQAPPKLLKKAPHILEMYFLDILLTFLYI